MSFLVKAAKGQSIVVDRGRKHAQAAGLSQGGALDEYSFLWANRLLGNRQDAAALEITLGQLTLVAQAATSIAITGAAIPVFLNQQPLMPWASTNIQAGDVLSVGFFNGHGTRLYIAVKGGFEAPEFYHSKSCVIREGLGGHHQGLPVAANQTLHFTPSQPQPVRITPEHLRKLPLAQQAIRFIPSYQYTDFLTTARKAFLRSPYQLTPQMDRMGFRLAGTPIAIPKNNIASEGISLGSIQITPQGQPMVLLSDRQNIGGYPKIGVVYRVDLGLLAQCAPGQQIHFFEGNLEEAWQLQQQREAFFNQQ